MEIEILGMNFSCVLSSLGNGKFPESDCLIPLFSKILGYCIVSASVIVKVPQIYKILKHNSVRGLSVASFELEVVGFTIALAYCLHKGLPFSAYGELFFLLLQAIILVVIIYYYSQPLGAKIWIKAALLSGQFFFNSMRIRYCAIAPTILAGQIDSILFEALYASQHAIFIFARIPQIWENYTIILVDCWICTRFLSYSRLDNFTEGCALFFCTITVRGPALTIIVLFDIQPLEQKHWGTQLLDNFHELWWFFCDFGIHERYFAAWYHFGSNAFMPKISSSKGEETRVKRGKGFSHIPDVDASSTKATRTSHVQ